MRELTPRRASRSPAAGIVVLAMMATARAHELPSGESYPHDLRELIVSWSFEPGVVLPLAVTTVAYVCGTLRLWRTIGRGRGIRWPEFACGVAAWLTLAVALVSPLHAWGSALFAAHMTQHELLMLVVAPLLVLSRPMIAFLWSLPAGWAPRLSRAASWFPLRVGWNVLNRPLIAWGIHGAVLWAWHIPSMFQATLQSEWVHSMQHMSFLFSALLFWWAIMHGKQRAVAFGVAVLYLFTTALHSGLLGALLTFARTAWYPAYAPRAASWGMTALQDQQLGGLIMWIPAGLVYIIAGLALFAAWLREAERRSEEIIHERRGII